MSSTVRQYGFVAVLLEAISEEEREAGNENQWENKTGIRVGYSGELVYIDFNYEKSAKNRLNFYGLFLGSAKPLPGESQKDFEAMMHRWMYDIDITTIQPYNCIYYNGGDSPLDMLTKEKFLAKDTSDL